MTITAKSHPFLFKCFQEIELDNGMVNRLHPARDEFPIPLEWEDRIDGVESFLSKLGFHSLDAICSGADDIADSVYHSWKDEPGCSDAEPLFIAFFDSGGFREC